MREEKKYLVNEVNQYLGKSDYLFVTDFTTLTVKEASELRSELDKQEAEFHVVKNRILRTAAEQNELPAFDEHLKGPSALVTGGKNPSEVAKVLMKFHKSKDKCKVKVGVLGDKVMTLKEVKALSELPSLDVLRAQFMGLLSQPAQQLVQVMNAVPQSMLNVLKAKSEKES